MRNILCAFQIFTDPQIPAQIISDSRHEHEEGPGVSQAKTTLLAWRFLPLENAVLSGTCS
jgi:hypothetical protein